LVTDRRFPPPWLVEETAPCFIVRDANGQAVAYVYCEEAAAKLLTRDEARRIAPRLLKVMPPTCEMPARTNLLANR
jgi:hypothetical protein